MKKTAIFLLAASILWLTACNQSSPAPATAVVKETVVVERPVTREVTRIVEVEVTREVTAACATTAAAPPPAISEHPVTEIPLTGPIANRSAEVSGLAWYGDWLILLPQYPDFTSGSDAFLYALAKTDILAFINDGITPPEPIQIPFIAPGLDEIDDYEGFEAIAFDGNTAYLTIEASPREGMRGYLVSGEMAEDLSKLVVDTTVLTEILPQNDIKNKAEEALFIADGRIVTLYETYGADVTDSPVAHRFDEDLAAVDTIPFPAIEYRLTDATAVDEDGRFWAINYFFPGDIQLIASDDPIADQYGQGETHQKYPYVERLVQFQYSDGGIALTNTPPIQIQLIALDARNWEGLARLDDLGFLLATDKYPTTILGFVAK